MKSGTDPYKILFPLGGVLGLFGVALWPLFTYGLITFYPRQSHASIMYFGFLWSFVAGFMMTAIPRMTQAAKANTFEVAGAVLLVIIQVAVSVVLSFKASVFVFILQSVFLIIFVLRRFLLHKRVPFFGVLFIPFAFFQAFAGAVVYLVWRPDPYVFFLLSGEAFILNLILGVGSRLIPVISRLPNAVMPDVATPDKKLATYLSLALILNLSFYVQLFYSQQMGLILRLAVILWVAFRVIKIYLKSEQNTLLGWGLRAGLLFLLSSYLVNLYEGAIHLPAQHLLFIGGFTLITLMVATRVVLAHGGVSLDYELKSKRIFIIILSVSMAAILRYLAGVNILGHLMLLAVIFLAVALLLWLRKTLKVHIESLRML
ncbi:MAG: NnrS family protein [Bdellovibrionales bacterium]|nr:NnrS family protein [Bdellovibrionales bacterium]